MYQNLVDFLSISILQISRKSAFSNFKTISIFIFFLKGPGKEIQIILRFFLIIAMYCRASWSQFNFSEYPNFTIWTSLGPGFVLMFIYSEKATTIWQNLQIFKSYLKLLSRVKISLEIFLYKYLINSSLPSLEHRHRNFYISSIKIDLQEINLRSYLKSKRDKSLNQTSHVFKTC